ncbi:helix-turn-helix domain containing protein [Saccharopolyspora sp. WRP15-2]|uniref:Helix-turn-helix domain containing protein n=1 Tax=Saccharopolyspora oryzae TaxID=2997343 RepID=A0ABT4UWH4_9PSEU|nr:helix-turn-helix domain-containing protein [Saccharopolyspora oryzae]MDA3626068.1 helix-turn-helix domain containing protein [Saccharopolyspora oryzae]
MSTGDFQEAVHGRARQRQPGNGLPSHLRSFYVNAYDGASMRDIAKAGGVTPAAIYHYYASKQELLMDIIGRFMQQSIETTRAAIAGAGQALARKM